MIVYVDALIVSTSVGSTVSLLSASCVLVFSVPVTMILPTTSCGVCEEGDVLSDHSSTLNLLAPKECACPDTS